MTYLVTDNCIQCKHTDCVEVCPVDCFYETENFLAINPEECIDCGVCQPECPVDAIFSESELGNELQKWLDINQKACKDAPVITEKKYPLPDANEWDGFPDKYEKFGIIPVKELL